MSIDQSKRVILTGLSDNGKNRSKTPTKRMLFLI